MVLSLNRGETCPLEVQCAEPWALQCFVVFTLFQKPGGENDVTEKVRTHLSAGPNENHPEPGVEALCGREGAWGPHRGSKGSSQLHTVLCGLPQLQHHHSGCGDSKMCPTHNQKLCS